MARFWESEAYFSSSDFTASPYLSSALAMLELVPESEALEESCELSEDELLDC